MPPWPMRRWISSLGNAAAISSSDGAELSAESGSSASRRRQAGQNPPGALAGMGAWQVGQIWGFTQVPDGCDGRGYKLFSVLARTEGAPVAEAARENRGGTFLSLR